MLLKRRLLHNYVQFEIHACPAGKETRSIGILLYFAFQGIKCTGNKINVWVSKYKHLFLYTEKAEFISSECEILLKDEFLCSLPNFRFIDHAPLQRGP